MFFSMTKLLDTKTKKRISVSPHGIEGRKYIVKEQLLQGNNSPKILVVLA